MPHARVGSFARVAICSIFSRVKMWGICVCPTKSLSDNRLHRRNGLRACFIERAGWTGANLGTRSFSPIGVRRSAVCSCADRRLHHGHVPGYRQATGSASSQLIASPWPMRHRSRTAFPCRTVCWCDSESVGDTSCIRMHAISNRATESAAGRHHPALFRQRRRTYPDRQFRSSRSGKFRGNAVTQSTIRPAIGLGASGASGILSRISARRRELPWSRLAR